jgi:hypothetical protein
LLFNLTHLWNVNLLITCLFQRSFDFYSKRINDLKSINDKQYDIYNNRWNCSLFNNYLDYQPQIQYVCRQECRSRSLSDNILVCLIRETFSLKISDNVNKSIFLCKTCLKLITFYMHFLEPNRITFTGI